MLRARYPCTLQSGQGLARFSLQIIHSTFDFVWILFSLFWCDLTGGAPHRSRNPWRTRQCPQTSLPYTTGPRMESRPILRPSTPRIRQSRPKRTPFRTRECGSWTQARVVGPPPGTMKGPPRDEKTGPHQDAKGTGPPRDRKGDKRSCSPFLKRL